MTGNQIREESDGKRGSDYHNLQSKSQDGFDVKWCVEIKEVDRRISYSLVKESSMVLDVGGAKGVDSFVFAEKGAFAINLDINVYSLKVGNEYAHKIGLSSKLNFIRASATNLPIRNEVIDLVTCFSTLDHLPNKRSAYEAIFEFSRVLRKQGHVAVTAPNRLFLIATISMKAKNLTEPEAFFEQRFTPRELFEVLSESGLKPVVFDSEFPKSVTPDILIFHFPKIFRKMPGIMILLSLGVRILNLVAKNNSMKLLGARMGYLAKKTDDHECT
jgi:SAM-dependent methyltransferase